LFIAVPVTQINVEAGEGGEAAAAAKKPSQIPAVPTGPDWSGHVARVLKVAADVFGPHGAPTFD